MASFFEKLTGSRTEESLYEDTANEHPQNKSKEVEKGKDIMDEIEEENEEGQLSVDVYQTPNEIIIQAITPGMTPDDLDITLTHEMITLKGTRAIQRDVVQEDFFYQELYWGGFGRSILLPQEVDPDNADAIVKNGILTITLPKLNKEKVSKLKVKTK